MWFFFAKLCPVFLYELSLCVRHHPDIESHHAALWQGLTRGFLLPRWQSRCWYLEGESLHWWQSSAGLWYQHWLLLFYHHCYVLLLVLNNTPSLWDFDTNTDYSTTAVWEDDDINTSVATTLASGLKWVCWIQNRNCHQFKCTASVDLRKIHCKSLTFVKKIHVAMFFLKCQMQGHHQSGCSYLSSGSCPLALSSAHLHSLESWQHQAPSHQ